MLLEPNAGKWNLDEKERKEIISYLPPILPPYRILVRRVTISLDSGEMTLSVGSWCWNRSIHCVFRFCAPSPLFSFFIIVSYLSKLRQFFPEGD
jgi:hypothetical protein